MSQGEYGEGWTEYWTPRILLLCHPEVAPRVRDRIEWVTGMFTLNAIPGSPASIEQARTAYLVLIYRGADHWEVIKDRFGTLLWEKLHLPPLPY